MVQIYKKLKNILLIQKDKDAIELNLQWKNIYKNSKIRINKNYNRKKIGKSNMLQ